MAQAKILLSGDTRDRVIGAMEKCRNAADGTCVDTTQFRGGKQEGFRQPRFLILIRLMVSLLGLSVCLLPASPVITTQLLGEFACNFVQRYFDSSHIYVGY